METKNPDKKKRIRIILISAAGALFLLTTVFGVLFLSALLTDDGEEEAIPYRQAEETTADAEAESLAALLREPAEEKTVSHDVITHRENELVFSLSMDDFISSFNGFYWQDHAARLLPPRENWGAERNRTSIHCDYETVCYMFSRDERVHSLPSLAVFAPPDEDLIQQITVDFDDHGYDQGMFEEYETMCAYVLRVFFPELPEQTLGKLIKTLNDYAYDHILPNEEAYTHGSIPQVLYHRNGVGIYPFFAVGQCVHFCVIPVTDATLAAFRAQGTDVKPLENTGA